MVVDVIVCFVVIKNFMFVVRKNSMMRIKCLFFLLAVVIAYYFMITAFYSADQNVVRFVSGMSKREFRRRDN